MFFRVPPEFVPPKERLYFRCNGVSNSKQLAPRSHMSLNRREAKVPRLFLVAYTRLIA